MQQQFVAGLRGLAGLAGIALLAAAWSSGSPSARSGASPSADLSAALGKLVQRLHAHGERGVYLSHAPASPNPGSTLLIFHGFAIQGADPGSAQFGPAMQACQHLLPHGTPPSAAELHQEFIQGLKAARCMRSHGYPTWPDPTDQYGYNTQLLPPANIDTSSGSSRRRPKRAGCSCHREAALRAGGQQTHIQPTRRSIRGAEDGLSRSRARPGRTRK